MKKDLVRRLFRRAHRARWDEAVHQLYALTVLAAAAVAAARRPPPASFGAAAGPEWYGWLAGGFAAPLVVLGAYLLIRFARGRGRYLGFLLRAAGDAGMLAVLASFWALYMLRHLSTGESVYLAVGFAGLLAAPVLWLIHDGLDLSLLNEVADGEAEARRR